jgi:hypothetical protein
LFAGSDGGCVRVGGVFFAVSVGGVSVVSGVPGQIVRTMTTPAARLTIADAAISACRFVGFNPISDANPPASFATIPAVAGFGPGGAGVWPGFVADSGFAAGSGFAAADAAGFGPGTDGSFTGVSTAIGSIRRPRIGNQ